MRVAAMGFTPSVTYGAEVTGMSDGMLASLRTLVVRSRGGCKGRSTTARLLMEDIGIQKVKAHTKWKEVMEGKVSQFDHVGNEAADKAAKEALAVAKLEAPAAAYNAAIATAVLWAKWIMDYAAIWDPRCPEEEEREEEA